MLGTRLCTLCMEVLWRNVFEKCGTSCVSIWVVHGTSVCILVGFPECVPVGCSWCVWGQRVCCTDMFPAHVLFLCCFVGMTHVNI